ncbi:MAG TPA: beta-ketoacyl-ACP reductase [Saprospiraceae bacterium]|nr:beta-ketoacyl-ACP reductase [Saprospiraceae bacterium]
MRDFTNRVCVITGGSQGIGKAIVRKLASLNGLCILWDIDEDKARNTLGEFSGLPGKISYYKVDVADVEQVNAAAEQTIQSFQKVDILINNAGITRDATLKKMSFNDWHQVINVNLNGVFYCAQALIPSMISNHYGRIINASSVVGLYGNFGQSNYAASKAAVIALTKVWARELGKHNITVNAIAPGFIETEMLGTMPDKLFTLMKSKSPLNRMGSPDEVASLYAYLASENAGFITGSVYSIDGGIII